MSKRRRDLADYERRIELETEIYSELTVIHDETDAELREEIKTVKEVIAIFQDETFTEYVKGVLNSTGAFLWLIICSDAWKVNKYNELKYFWIIHMIKFNPSYNKEITTINFFPILKNKVLLI